MNLLKRLSRVLSAGRELPPANLNGWTSLLSGFWSSNTAIKYQEELGKGKEHLTSVVFPIIAWKYSAAKSSALILEQWSDKDSKWVRASPVAEKRALLPFKNGSAHYDLSSIIYLHVLGEAVWGTVPMWKRKTSSGVLIGLEPIHPANLNSSNSRDPLQSITHWEYTSVNGTFELELEDVVTTKFGVNPDNPVFGLPQLAGSWRSVFMVEEGDNYQASNLRNQGKPSVLISPKPIEDISSVVDQLRSIAQYINSFRYDKRGEAAVIPFPADISVPGWKPTDLDLLELSKSTTEKICAALLIDGKVLGFNSSKETYSNKAEAIDAAGKQTIMPMASNWCEQWSLQILPDVNLDPEVYRYNFDFSAAWWLSDETNAVHERVRANFEIGLIDRAEGREAIGYKPDPKDKGVLYVDIQRRGQPEPKPTQKAFVTKAPVIADVASDYQAEHDRLVKRGYRRLKKLSDELGKGDISEDEFRSKFASALNGLHVDLHLLGQEAAGVTPDNAAAKLVAQQIVDFEGQWIAGLVTDLLSETYKDADGVFDQDHGSLVQRLQWYAQKGSSTASRAWVDYGPDLEEFDWDLGGTEHCEDCPFLASGSPYTKDTLPTVPRGYETACLGNCDCKLTRRSDGMTGFMQANF